MIVLASNPRAECSDRCCHPDQCWDDISMQRIVVSWIPSDIIITFSIPFACKGLLVARVDSCC